MAQGAQLLPPLPAAQMFTEQESEVVDPVPEVVLRVGHEVQSGVGLTRLPPAE